MSEISMAFLTAVTEGRLEDARSAITAGADVAFISPMGESAAHYCAREPGQERILFLHAVGAPLEYEARGQRRAIHEAAYKGFPDAIVALHACGVDIDAEDEWGERPIHRAALALEADAVRALLGFGADPFVMTNDGDSPLHLALASPTITVMLLEAGCDPMLRDRQQNNAYEAAAKSYPDTMHVLQSWKARKEAERALQEMIQPPTRPF